MIKGSNISLLQKIDIKEEITPELFRQVGKNLLRFHIFKITVIKHAQLCKEKVAQPLQAMGIPKYTASATNHKNQTGNSKQK